MKEIWKSIPGYEGLYEVSNLGNVKSLIRNRILNPSKECGYLKTTLSNKTKKKFAVHQLVAMAFLNHIPCGHKLVIDHKNENKLDNRSVNLQIVTNKQNIVKSIKIKQGI